MKSLVELRKSEVKTNLVGAFFFHYSLFFTDPSIDRPVFYNLPAEVDLTR